MNKDNQEQAIQEARLLTSVTRRPTVMEIEDILFTPFPVLDHGLIRVVDYMGNDSAIVQAARVSYGRGTTQINNDRNLIRYLVRHRHTTPLEMCEIKLHVKLPIFIARQWIRHRMASVNEYSARYSILDREFYLPEPEQIAEQSKSNKQGREKSLTTEQSERVLRLLRDDANRCYDHYEDLLNEDETGKIKNEDNPQLARELARMNLTLNYYTQWYWKIDLHNLLHFLSLRMDSHAQYEIRVYANIIGDIVSKWVPLAWEAFKDYRFEGTSLSRMEIQIIKDFINGNKPDLNTLSVREKQEFLQKFGIDKSYS